ncbi:MAG: rubredoxin [Raoultibacter sp.]
MGKYVCQICGFVYDEAVGVPEAGIAPGTPWEDVPHDWVCPLCGASKDEFEREQDAESIEAQLKQTETIASVVGDSRELSMLEVSALCSNLARGCEKQYLAEESRLFTQLADYFKSKAIPDEQSGFDELLSLVESDLFSGLPRANTAATTDSDRGALRSLVWSEKVTRILKSLLTRYEKEGDAMIEGTNVYVCTICGFISVGDTPPEWCPVCRVPSWKFTKIEGR